jgi:hypothetical protein
MLEYFYGRNKNATSGMGKKGSAVKISQYDSSSNGSDRSPIDVAY